MFLLRLAWKNLLRTKRRTALSSGAVVLGVFYLIVGRSFIGGLDEGIIAASINGFTAHVTVRAAGYPQQGLNHPIDDRVPVNDAMRGWLDQQKAWTTRQLFIATVISGSDSLRVRGVAFDPDRDPQVFARTLWEVQGAIPREHDDGVLVASGLAKLLGVGVGDHLVVKARTAAGALNALDLPVAGLVQPGNLAMNTNTIFFPQSLATDLLRTEEPTHVHVLLADRDESAAAGSALVALAGPETEATTWQTESKDLLDMQTIRKKALNVLVGMLMVMSSLAIANTILMAAHERVREIGTLRAMGMSRRSVLALFLAEGGLMGGIAGSLGALIGGAVAFRLNTHPINLAGLSKGIGDNMAISSYIYGAFSPQLILLPLALSVVVALVASIYPAFTASGMEPADAVRAE